MTTDRLEKHHLGGGSVLKVVDAMITARNRDVDVPFEVVAKAGLAGYDLEKIKPQKSA